LLSKWRTTFKEIFWWQCRLASIWQVLVNSGLPDFHQVNLDCII
jgi:hypothetical protein